MLPIPYVVHGTNGPDYLRWVAVEINGVVAITAVLIVTFPGRSFHLVGKVSIEHGPHLEEGGVGPETERFEPVNIPSFQDLSGHVYVLEFLDLTWPKELRHQVCVAGWLKRLPPHTVSSLTQIDFELEVVRNHSPLLDFKVSGEVELEGWSEDVLPVASFCEIPKYQNPPVSPIIIFSDHHTDTTRCVIDVRNERVTGLHRLLCIVSTHEDLLDLGIDTAFSIAREV